MNSFNNGKRRATSRGIRVSPFNMIEITVAIGVVAVGMVSLMVLFPIGFNAHRDAIGESYASDLADQVLHVMKYDIQKNWTKVASLPASKPTVADDVRTVAGSTQPFKTSDGAFSNIYTAEKEGGGSTDGYYVEMKTGSMTDFSAQVLVWKSDVNVTLNNSTTWPATTQNKAIGLNMEISWPAGKPYKNREKRCFHLEVFKP